MRYFCIALGMADYTPDVQEYYAAADANEQREIVAYACKRFDIEQREQDNEEPHKYAFHLPLDGVDNYSQRLRIARGTDYVLDVIGMTETEYEREQGE